jgi:hypothetical protein
MVMLQKKTALMFGTNIFLVWVSVNVGYVSASLTLSYSCSLGIDIDTEVRRMTRRQASSYFFVDLQLEHSQKLHVTHLML